MTNPSGSRIQDFDWGGGQLLRPKCEQSELPAMGTYYSLKALEAFGILVFKYMLQGCYWNTRINGGCEMMASWRWRTCITNYARFICTVCTRRIRWSCEGLTSVTQQIHRIQLKHLLLRLSTTCHYRIYVLLYLLHPRDCYRSNGLTPILYCTVL